MALLVAVGPIFIACALWPASRAFFSGWVASCVSTLTAQILVVALMSLMLQWRLTQLASDRRQSDNANEVGQIGSLIGVAALLGICSLLAKQIPAVAVGIAGGAYHNLNSYANAIGAAGTAGSKLINIARGPSGGGGSGSGGAPQSRPNHPHSRLSSAAPCPGHKAMYIVRVSARSQFGTVIRPVLPLGWRGDRGLRRANRGDGDRAVGRITHPADLCHWRLHQWSADHLAFDQGPVFLVGRRYMRTATNHRRALVGRMQRQRAAPADIHAS